MLRFRVPKEEWAIAKNAFEMIDKEGKGIKLPRSNKASNRDAIESLGLCYQTNHSFFKFSQNPPLIATNPKTKDKIFPMNSPMLGEGLFSNTKLGIMQSNERGTLNIQPVDPKTQKSAQSSFWIHYELGLSLSFHTRNDEFKNNQMYTVMRYTGQSLKHNINFYQQQLRIETRFQWSAKMAFQVHMLHEGWQSSRGMKFVHSNININSFTINHFGQIRLINFEHAYPFNSKDKNSLGILHDRAGFLSSLSNIEQDSYALYQTLCFPDQEGERNESSYTLLRGSLLEKHNLSDFMDSLLEQEGDRNKVPVLKFAAHLALVSIGHDLLIKLCDTVEQQQAIMTLLHANKLKRRIIVDQLQDKVLVSQLAAIAPIAAWLNPKFLQGALQNKKIMSDCILVAKAPLSKRYLLVELWNKTGLCPNYPLLHSLKIMIDKIETHSNLNFLMNKYNLLSCCVAYNEPKLLKRCLQLGGDPNRMDNLGSTPLKDALWENKRACYMPLLGHINSEIYILHPNDSHVEFSVHSYPHHSKEPLKDLENYYQVKNYSDVLGDRNERAKYLDSVCALNLACQFGYAGLAKKILRLNANINHQDLNANTPLMLAIENEQVDCIHLLLGAMSRLDLSLENNKQEKAFDVFYRKLSQSPELSVIEDQMEAFFVESTHACGLY